jgi:hypothetical protein
VGDVRCFLENPGEVLERVTEQLTSDDVAELETDARISPGGSPRDARRRTAT